MPLTYASMRGIVSARDPKNLLAIYGSKGAKRAIEQFSTSFADAKNLNSMNESRGAVIAMPPRG